MLSGLSDLLWNPTNRNPVHRLIPAEHQQDPVTAGPIVAVGKAVQCTTAILINNGTGAGEWVYHADRVGKGHSRPSERVGSKTEIL